MIARPGEVSRGREHRGLYRSTPARSPPQGCGRLYSGGGCDGAGHRWAPDAMPRPMRLPEPAFPLEEAPAAEPAEE
eukprot:2803034-Prymnesium_polylepis.1